MLIRKILLSTSLLLWATISKSQSADSSLSIQVMDERSAPLEGVTIQLIRDNDKKLVKADITDASGSASFKGPLTGDYFLKLSYTGHEPQTSPVYSLPTSGKKTISLLPASSTLGAVKVVSARPFVQRTQGKVLINVEAAVTNVGTTVLEVLEKSPGVMVDKNGSISLQGKAGVLVLIDDKPTYLSGSELSNLLGSMSSTQVDQIELMPNPPAKYDASGNAGIINIKTKKNKQRGFNGSLTIAAGQGRYPKNNNSLVMNYRNGKFNSFLTYSVNINKYFTDIYALRNYYDDNGNIIAKLDQPTYYTGTGFNNTLKLGIDYYASAKTTLGIALTGVAVTRKGKGDANAIWLDANNNVDSSLLTTTASGNRFRNGGVNASLRHVINSSQDLSIDIDWLNYDISNNQSFNNQLLTAGGYSNISEGYTPSAIKILSGKIDHVLRPGKNSKLETGWKSSRIKTDNDAAYRYFDGAQWLADYDKSNHFLYTENIHALYSSYELKHKRISVQGGLRYEYTSYDANQLGNPMRKDSAFSRNYDGLFPSGYISYELDSANSFTFTAGRRIDRPAFQKLNPFVFIINKYTYQRGNPFFLPQYSWNMELSHQYKQLLTTTVSYSIIENYFSQLFLNEGGDILTYTEGNVGKAYNLGVAVAVQASPASWWSLNGQAMFNYKELKGYNGNEDFRSSIRQLNLNMSNQFKIGKTYSGEISGFYTTRARNDLQELLYPTGQLSVGVSRPVLKKKGTLKLSFRDIFYTQAMEGLTDFDKADEYFILTRDTRVVNLSFTYRFGKPLKAARRNAGGATDEMERVGTGN